MITAVTFCRRVNYKQFGINEASLLRHEITPMLVVPRSFLMTVVSTVRSYLSRVFLVDGIMPELTPGGFVFSWPVGTPYVNAQTAPTALRRPPR